MFLTLEEKARISQIKEKLITKRRSWLGKAKTLADMSKISAPGLLKRTSDDPRLCKHDHCEWWRKHEPLKLKHELSKLQKKHEKILLKLKQEEEEE